MKNRHSFLQPVRAFVQTALCCTLGISGAGEAVAQTNAFASIAQDFDQHRKKGLQEKLFLHLDRPVYACGETMWFKVYSVDGTLHQTLDMSKVVYVEVLDATKRPVLQGKIELKEGMGKGSFILPATLNSGNYTVRAYTSWMKNFSPEFFFEQPVAIINTFQQLEAPAAPEAAAYAIQFFPEGGNMVAGVTNKVAFKAVNEKTGKGVDVAGELHDQQGNKVADFRPHKFGIGHFTFTPAAGATYTATLTTPNGNKLKQPLPKVYEQGYTLQLQDTDAHTLQVLVNQVGRQAEQLYLLGHTRQMIAVAESGPVNQGTATFSIDKSALADGITHFTVFNAQKQPVCERLYFKRPAQTLQLAVAADKQQYGTRQKVTLDLLAQGGATNSAAANVSLAVYKLDSLQGMPTGSIESYLWLTSDLKGTVENPAYYFSGDGATDSQAMDNLLLTHGWSRFRWDDILDKKPAAYAFVPEHDGHLISGKVTARTSRAPAPGVVAYLSSPGRHINLYNATSNANGGVLFKVKDFYGLRDIVMQSNFLKDSTYHFEVFSPFSDQFAQRQLPAFRLPEVLQHELTLRHVQAQVQYAYFGDYSNRYRPSGTDSIAFYGRPDYHYKLDDYKRFKVMEEVMREYVPGVLVRIRRGKFHFMVINRLHRSVFQNNPMVLLDGVPVFNIDKIIAFDPLKVEKLDVVTALFFHGPLIYEGLVSYTTYKGDLAGFELDPRSLLQEYEGLQLEREFYAPAYESEAQQQSRLADFRNLLHWVPDLKLRESKSEKLSFYTSDQAGTYLVVVQGITREGVAGSNLYTFKVEQPL